MTEEVVQSEGAAKDLKHWRRQRNRFAVVAMVVLVLMFAIALPRRLRDYHRLRNLNQELIDLQANIVNVQEQIRGVQAAILQAQDQLK